MRDELLKNAVDCGRKSGTLLGATSVFNNESLTTNLAKCALGLEWAPGKDPLMDVAQKLVHASEEFTLRMREAVKNNDQDQVFMLSHSLVAAVLNANDDIETVTGAVRFEKECPDTGCGGCTGC
jgi:hypothetical protein